MPKIKVERAFALKVKSGADIRQFAPGVHEVSAEELAHWYTQAHINEGVVVVLAEAETEPKNDFLEFTESSLTKMNADNLKKLAADLGVTHDEKATKKDIAALILNDAEKITCTLGEDGVYALANEDDE